MTSEKTAKTENITVGFATYAHGVGFNGETDDVQKLLRIYQELKEGLRGEPGYAPINAGSNYGRR